MLTHLTQGLTINIQHIRNRYEGDPRNASALLAQFTPRILYIADAKSENPAPKELHMRSLPANTEAA